jgi:dihydroorotase
MIKRDIELLKYTNSKLHITCLSTRKGIELVENAKKDGLKITASVTPYHCFFCDEDLEQYDTNLKVNPPLRKRADMMAVRESLIGGTIDCIASHHIPQHWDDKTCEFEYAKNGMIGLETLFGVVNGFENEIVRLIDKLTIAPRRIFNIEIPQIIEGAAACLTLFDKDQKYIFERSMIKSKSHNSPFIGKALKGKVIGIINKNKIVINP